MINNEHMQNNEALLQQHQDSKQVCVLNFKNILNKT